MVVTTLWHQDHSPTCEIPSLTLVQKSMMHNLEKARLRREFIRGRTEGIAYGQELAPWIKFLPYLLNEAKVISDQEYATLLTVSQSDGNKMLHEFFSRANAVLNSDS